MNIKAIVCGVSAVVGVAVGAAMLVETVFELKDEKKLENTVLPEEEKVEIETRVEKRKNAIKILNYVNGITSILVLLFKSDFNNAYESTMVKFAKELEDVIPEEPIPFGVEAL